MEKELEKYLENALRMARELMHAGAKATAREGATEESTFAMNAGSALLKLTYLVAKLTSDARAMLEKHDVIECELRGEISRLTDKVNSEFAARDKQYALERELHGEISRLHCALQVALETNEEQTNEISRLNTRLRDMAEESNKVAAYKSERDEYREKYELVNAVNDSLESILDDTERQRDALKAERDNAWLELERIRHAVNANPEESTLDEVRRVVHQRDLARAKLERTSNDINALIEKYS